MLRKRVVTDGLTNHLHRQYHLRAKLNTHEHGPLIKSPKAEQTKSNAQVFVHPFILELEAGQSHIKT